MHHKMSKERLLMAIITLHHLLFGHCTLPQNNTSVHINHLRIHTMTSKKWCAIIIFQFNKSAIPSISFSYDIHYIKVEHDSMAVPSFIQITFATCFYRICPDSIVALKLTWKYKSYHVPSKFTCIYCSHYNTNKNKTVKSFHAMLLISHDFNPSNSTCSVYIII